jgi:hypothetical protein
VGLRVSVAVGILEGVTVAVRGAGVALGVTGIVGISDDTVAHPASKKKKNGKQEIPLEINLLPEWKAIPSLFSRGRCMHPIILIPLDATELRGNEADREEFANIVGRFFWGSSNQEETSYSRDTGRWRG